MIKALFIPLKTEYFNAFKDGSKCEELRLYGKRWNEKTCYKGRKVILSKGYGKYERLEGVVLSVKKQHASTFGSTHRKAIKEIYGSLDIYICCIHITDLKEVKI